MWKSFINEAKSSEIKEYRKWEPHTQIVDFSSRYILRLLNKYEKIEFVIFLKVIIYKIKILNITWF
ncbi:hypothetical protein DR092_02720 [Mycoplasma hyorhinis]|nr:hypothetical protein [Mesomycoplasma hyorhinis]MXR09629.1 hypothetical protein [Mesomycoplasma hyorhinis]MXR11727.1 hypothetical protein [Mesomycoplasma hyorhinis]